MSAVNDNVFDQLINNLSFGVWCAKFNDTNVNQYVSKIGQMTTKGFIQNQSYLSTY